MPLPVGWLIARQEVVVDEVFVQLTGHSSFGHLGNERQVWHRTVVRHVSYVQARLLQQRWHDRVLLRVGQKTIGQRCIDNVRSMNLRIRKVGTGSSEQDLIGDVMPMRRTSAGVHGRNDDNVDGVLDTASGAGRSAVARRISSIFFCRLFLPKINFSLNKAFIDIRLRPGIATPFVVVASLHGGSAAAMFWRHAHYGQTWRHP